MKKIGFTLLIATSSLNLFCQQDNIIVLDSIYHYGWDTITHNWVADQCAIYAYDANGNRTESIGYEWDSETNDWEGETRCVYIYWISWI